MPGRSLKKHILMVEDDEKFCDFVIRRHLLGYAVEVVQNVHVAISLLESNRLPFDLVLMDIELLK